jgi:hypothetical protein
VLGLGLGAHPSANQGSELCLAIVDPPMVWSHLSKGMWIATVHHVEMAGHLTMFRVAASSVV